MTLETMQEVPPAARSEDGLYFESAWTVEEQAKFRFYKTVGASVEEIAAALNKDPREIILRLPPSPPKNAAPAEKPPAQPQPKVYTVKLPVTPQPLQLAATTGVILKQPKTEWTEEEIASVQRLWATNTVEEISDLLQRPVKDIEACKRANWTSDEIETLRTEWNAGKSLKEIALKLEMPDSWVREKALSLGLSARCASPWTEEQVSLLREKYRTCPLQELAEQVSRSKQAVAAKLKQLQLHEPASAACDHPAGSRPHVQAARPKKGSVLQPAQAAASWKPAEIELLEKLWVDHSVEEIAAELHRSRDAIRWMASQRELGAETHWSHKEIRQFKSHHNDMTDRELAAHFGKREPAVRHLAQKLGLVRRFWNDARVERLIALYLRGQSDGRMAKALGTTSAQVVKMRRLLGLRLVAK